MIIFKWLISGSTDLSALREKTLTANPQQLFRGRPPRHKRTLQPYSNAILGKKIHLADKRSGRVANINNASTDEYASGLLKEEKSSKIRCLSRELNSEAGVYWQNTTKYILKNYKKLQ